MAPSYDSLRLRNQRQIDARLTAAHRRLAEQMALEVIRAAGPDGLIPADTRTREALRLAIWERVLKPYYVGSGTDALIGPEPQSPYAKLLVAGIEQATRIQAERQAALVRRVVRDPEVVAWLTGPRPVGILTVPTSALPPVALAGIAFNPTRDVLGGLRGPDGRIDVERARTAIVNVRGSYRPFHEWVDPNGYRLSDRVWRTSVEVRSRIDAMMTYEIGNGTSAVAIAKMLDPFMTPSAATTKTKKPYGTSGSYAARRLARTEVTAAAGRATVNAAAANPFVERLQWRLSASHPRVDHCDDNARGGPNGDGIYEIADLPTYPDHPHCCLPGQMVDTVRGPIPIEQVKENDFVLTHKGRYRRVLAAWATPHDGTVYEIETAYGTVELTGNHPVLTRRDWINAEDIQLGDEVLYAGVNVAPNGPAVVANGDPAERGESIVPQIVPFRADAMPAGTIALDSNLEVNEGEIDHVGSNAKLLNEADSVAAQGIGHPDLQLRAGSMAKGALHGAEPLGFVALFDLERLPTVFANDVDAAVKGVMLLPVGEMGEAGIVQLFGGRDFAPDFGPLGGVAVAGEIEAQSRFAHLGAGGNATRPIVLLPTGGNGIAHCPHGDIVQGEQVAQDAIGDSVLSINLGAGKPLLDVDLAQQNGDGATVFGFEPRGVVLHRGHRDNLLSLSPVDSVGRGSGNPLVDGVITPIQAPSDYTSVRAIRLRHYTGPVYNMEVVDDHSYTVNGAVCHNCLCSILPVPTGSTADLVATLRADIQAAKGNLIDAVAGGDAERGQRLRGLLNPQRMTQSLLDGTLDTTIADAVKRSATVVPVAKPVVASTPVYNLSEGTRVREGLLTEYRTTGSSIEKAGQEIDIHQKNIDNLLALAKETDMPSEEVFKQLKPLQQLRKEAMERQLDLIQNNRQRLLKTLSLPEAEQSSIVTSEGSAFRGKRGVVDMRQRISESTEFVNQVTAGVKVDLDIIPNATGREFASPGAIHIDTKTTHRTIVHEIGHNIEFQRGAEFRAKRIAFFDKRTQGDELQKLADLHPGSIYGDTEVVKVDKWHSDYVGKVYAQWDSDKHPTSEVISMGIDRLWSSPVEFAEQDSEFFDFTVSFLRGTL